MEICIGRRKEPLLAPEHDDAAVHTDWKTPDRFGAAVKGVSFDT